MSVRIALASSDGKVINQHFGAAREFQIVDVEGDSFTFVESRENTPPCQHGQHSEDGLMNSASLLSDCRMVLVSAIGPGARAVLSSHGIEAVEYPGFIDSAIKSLQSSKYFIRNYLQL